MNALAGFMLTRRASLDVLRRTYSRATSCSAPLAWPQAPAGQGELVDLPTVAASRFKNEFGAIFEQAARGGAVAITKHDAPKAVLLSYAEFESLVKSRSPGRDDLSTQFDGLLARMQAPKSKAAMAAAFDASPAQLGRAAVKVTRLPRGTAGRGMPSAQSRAPRADGFVGGGDPKGSKLRRCSALPYRRRRDPCCGTGTP